MSIRKLIIENVRCFGGRQEFNIRPLTFLVGENSSSKSTMLGCFQTLSTFIRESVIDFNAEPYQMGSFVDIVKKSRPVNNTFRLGFVFQCEEKSIEYLLDFGAKEEGSEPVILRGEAIFKNESNEILCKAIFEVEDRPRDSHQADFSSTDSSLLRKINGIITLNFTVDRDTYILRGPWGMLKWLTLEYYIGRDLIEYPPEDRSLVFDFLQKMEEVSQPRIQSFAPVRSRPQRTYDPLKEEFSPEGSEIPVMLRNMSMTNRAAWQKLKEQLVQFGRASGLFSDIDVRSLGKTVGDPFQLHLKIKKGPKVNLIDTGYGVNQILPILVRILNSSRRTTFLMQQPEVHLHPKGQAELSSLLIDLIKERKHRFVIETHSDYMVDRARIEIRKGTIKAEDVSLIYMEPKGSHVNVHNMSFDKMGNLRGAPNSYREFFLKETDRLLGYEG